MRVRVDNPEPPQGLRWRGVALDELPVEVGRNRRTPAVRHKQMNAEVSFRSAPEALHRLTTQTFFVEPLESAVLFGAPRIVAIQGDLPFVRVDAEDGLQSRRHDFERIMYKAISDTNEPPAVAR